MYSIKNSFGFSLPEITVALGLVGGISLVTMKMMENQSNNQNRLKATAEIAKATSLIKTALGDPDNCRAILGSKTVGSAGIALIGKIKEPNGTLVDRELVSPNTKYKGFRTRGISLNYPSNGLRTVAEIAIEYEIETNSMFFNDRTDNNERIVRNVIPVVVQTDPTNVITDCGPVVSEVNQAAKQKMCESLGGMTEFVGGECKLKEARCSYGYVPVRFTSSGSVECVDAATQLNPTSIFNISTCPIGTSRNFRVEVGADNRLVIRCY